DDAIKELYLQPIHEPFRQLVNAGSFEWLIQNRASASGEVPATQEAALDEAEAKYHRLLVEIEKMFGEPLVASETVSTDALSEMSEPAVAAELIDLQTLAEAFRANLEAALQLPALEKLAPIAGVRKQRQMMAFLEAPPEAQPAADQPGAEKPMGWNTDDPYRWGVLLGWVVVRHLGQALESGAPARSLSRAWIDEWLLGKYIANTLRDLNVPAERVNHAVALIKLLTIHQGWQTDNVKPKNERPLRALNRWLGDGETQQFLGINRHNDILWFNAEAFDMWLWWAFVGAAVDVLAGDDATELDALYTVVQTVQKAEKASAYQVTRLLEAVNPKQAAQKAV
ncbi:MAG TPA: hypothetical protein VLS48_05865, partial [Anaerolineales bacterium]|nr:hypothetical protein [Anaerolineales bacterium]